MTPKELQNAIGNVDDDYIKEAAKVAEIPSKVWIPAVTLAACILLTVALVPWSALFSNNGSPGKDPIHTDTGFDALQNEDTTNHDPLKGNDGSTAKPPDDSTQQNTDDTTENGIKNTTPSDGGGSNINIDPSNDAAFPDTEKREENSKEETTTGPQDSTDPLMPNKPADPGITLPQGPVVLSRSMYPVQDQYPLSTSLRTQWRIEKDERINYYQSGVGNTDDFMSLTISEFFSDSGDKNLIYSPVNAYMTLGMLSETTQGSSRTQLLNLLSENNIFSLRSSARNLWNCCYRDDGIVTSILANSMWLDNSFVPDTAITDVLAENYYASSFYGNMGDEEYNELMRSWLNEQTKGILKDTVAYESLNPESEMSLMSTLYFKADWAVKFDTEVTRNMIFHSLSGDVTAPFMYRDFVGLRYVGQNFESTYLQLEEGGEMWFILPDENVSLQSLFSDSEAMGFITGKTQKTLNYKEHSAYMWLFLPKFDISSQIDLANGLKRLGITEIFNSDKADFSSLTESRIYTRDITQSAKVCIDENGCEAASVSGGLLPGVSVSQPVGFALNRPFIFVVTSDTGIPLFVGTVNRPN